MGYELISQVSDNLVGVGRMWGEILDEAEKFGWKPPGTLPPFDWHKTESEWPGIYLGNGWQVVSEPDAWELAQALYRAAEAREEASRMDENAKLNRALGPLAAYLADNDGPFLNITRTRTLIWHNCTERLRTSLGMEAS